MAKLKAARRNKLPRSDFGLPGQRKYPMPDKSHAAVAKSYASKEEHSGTISPGQEAEIDRKADRVLGKRDGGGRGTIMAAKSSKAATMPSRDGTDDATAANQQRQGARDGLGHGKGGLASHANMAHMHGDGCMYREKY